MIPISKYLLLPLGKLIGGIISLFTLYIQYMPAIWIIICLLVIAVGKSDQRKYAIIVIGFMMLVVGVTKCIDRS